MKNTNRQAIAGGIALILWGLLFWAIVVLAALKDTVIAPWFIITSILVSAIFCSNTKIQLKKAMLLYGVMDLLSLAPYLIITLIK